ncbi:type II toxin-antitoxin system SpoIISA family toxin [Evansella sp. AB-P1]|uniref:type II toxin-antitoxin system SpoIISA family toxin n=1 Tax=Evansella sp. AB-P1 TaxID=3037653 RepID=UPI00241FD525|nr:type II toxin-antitoxin system SpoIISA family toxin [Evansella sp. AB-P1]MDG5789797.1 type II toxin-antitoxin system SpoIISA family toxin [Evansella sp. AB-P1]
MDNFIKYTPWVLFLLLVIYIFFSWKYRELIYKFTEPIRKTWYSLFVLCSLIYLTVYPDTLITHWISYVIVFVAFVLIDSFIFLNLQFSKIGGQELQSTKIQVGITQEELDQSRKKMGHIPLILTTFDFPIYTENKEDYINQLDNLLKKYENIEPLDIHILPYSTKKEQEELLEDLGYIKKNKVIRSLKQNETITINKDTIGFYPFKILDDSYVIRVEPTDSKLRITEDDGNAITTLVVTYTLAVQYNDGSGEEV